MNILFELNHPKHYYQYRHVMDQLSSPENKVVVIARNKDILLSILKEENISYSIYGKYGKSIFAKFFILPSLLIQYYKILKKNKIELIISKASPYAAILGWFAKIKTVISPDSEVVKLTQKFVAPYSSLIITPKTYANDYGIKHKRFNGFFEDCYLHPSVFHPDKNIVSSLGINVVLPYFILRFVGWNANHDINNFGFSNAEKIELVNILNKRGRVYISSENELPLKLESYKLKIPASKIHHVLHFANLYIGDSQTMATEAALLGTPSIRYNSFVGPNDMTNFIVLENVYGLLKNFGNYNDVKKCIDDIMEKPDCKNNGLRKRKNYYSVIGNPNKNIQNIIQEYIESIK